MPSSPERAATSKPSSLLAIGRFAACFAACFWLWAKFLFSPQLVYLPPLPPVEVFFADIEKYLGPWPAAIFPLAGVALVAWDGAAFRREHRPKAWVMRMLAGVSSVLAIHTLVWLAGSLLFFGLFSLAGKQDVADPSGAARGGLILFCAFFSLILAGPATLLVAAAGTLWLRQRQGPPARALEALNTLWAIVLVPLLFFWGISGDPGKTMHALFEGGEREAAARNLTLIEAVRQGDAAAVHSAIRSQTDLNAKDAVGSTPLIIAAASGGTEIARALIEAGADANARDNFKATALMAAAKNGETEIVRLLVRAGAEVNARNDFGGTALMSAAARGHAETVRVLLEAGADANAKDHHGDTALSVALAVKNSEIIQILHEAAAPR